MDVSDASTSAVTVEDLWFSYEVVQNTSSTAKTLDATKEAVAEKKHTRTLDGGCSLENPRSQYASSVPNEIVYKLQLAGVNMTLPMGARCMLVGANGAGKTTLMSVIGGKHKVGEDNVRVLGRPAFEDTTLASEVALLTGNWTHTVSFVGHNVPYQAMEVSRLVASASVGVDPERVARLVSLLEVDQSWNLTAVSDGQRRRVQILCKLIKPFKILLLDEITTDLDLLARHDLLTWLREESEQRGVTILYCTHIFDGLDGWASHIAYVRKGEMVFSQPVTELATSLDVPVAQRSRGWGTLFCAVQRWLLEARPDFAKLLTLPKPEVTWQAPEAVRNAGPAVKVTDFSWKYSSSKARNPQLQNLSFEIPRGARCLLVGANGAGKTTMLRLLGSKHMIPAGAVQCLSYDAFHDMELNTLVALLSGDWTRQVACVGNGVPFQADFSVGSMAEALVAALIRDGADPELIHSRRDRLVTLLDMDLEWRLHQVSDGQRRRAQLLLKLLRPSQLLLMDEVTTDLDVVSRQALLQFLREECDERGATVVYSTHILDGLDDWPSHLLHLKGGTLNYCGEIAKAPGASALSGPSVLGGSGSLFSLVKKWLLEEREQNKSKALDVACDSTPSTDSVVQAAPAPAPVKSSFGGKFDRFGGASRQNNMYG